MMPRGFASKAATATSPKARATAPRRRLATSPRRSPILRTASASDGGGGGSSTSPPPTTTTSTSTTKPSEAAASAARALQLVDEAMDMLHRELFVSEAIARATGEEPEDEGSVAARVVEALASGKKSSSIGEEEFGGGFFEEREAGQDDALLRGLSSSSSSSSEKKQQANELDEAFLVALGIAAAAATSPPSPAEEGGERGGGGSGGENKNKNAEEEDSKAQEIARRLRMLRDATLSRASASLPAELRALDAAARAASAAERRAVVREALVGRKGRKNDKASPSPSSPAPPLKRVSPAAFYSAACQVIDDMEERQIVPDAALLARVVLCRDDALALQRDNNDGDGGSDSGGSGNGSGNSVSGTNHRESAFADSPADDADLRDAVGSHGAMLHRGGAEFAAMLVSQECKNSEARRELVRTVMRRGDVLAWQRRETDGSSIPSLQKARAAPRPGRLFAALYATRDALAVRGDSERAAALERARRDAVAVMEEIAYGR